jgi:hypothetical protein
MDKDDKPSWEIYIDNLFEDMKKNIKMYLNTDHFQKEWHFWEAHEATGVGAFRGMIRYYLDINRYNNFPIKTETLCNTILIIEYTICALFKYYYKTHTKKTYSRLLKCIDIAFDSLEPNDYPSLQSEIYEEYKHLWNAAEKIQIQWKITIANPKYILCKKRLNKEFNQIINA